MDLMTQQQQKEKGGGRERGLVDLTLEPHKCFT